MTIPIDLPWWAFYYAFAMLALIPALALLAGASVIWLRHIPWWIGLGLGLLLAVANYGSAYLGMIAATDTVRSGSFIAFNVGLLAGPVASSAALLASLVVWNIWRGRTRPSVGINS